jgi:hypothetical protein
MRVGLRSVVSCLFDHLVGELLEMSRHLKTERLRRLEVDN